MCCYARDVDGTSARPVRVCEAGGQPSPLNYHVDTDDYITSDRAKVNVYSSASLLWYHMASQLHQDSDSSGREPLLTGASVVT